MVETSKTEKGCLVGWLVSSTHETPYGEERAEKDWKDAGRG